MTERTALTKPRVISELTRSPHGDLSSYLPVATQAAIEDPEFYAHLIAWNHEHGQIRDAQIALPVAALVPRVVVHLLSSAVAVPCLDNALAHLADLNPRQFMKAMTFARTARVQNKLIRRLMTRYLRDLESDRKQWESRAVQHREPLKGIYTYAHEKPVAWANAILFDNYAPAGSVFAAIRALSTHTDPEVIAATIVDYKIPFLIARGAIGTRANDPAVVKALIARMSPTELTTNAKALEKMGVATNPELQAAWTAALAKASRSKTSKATLKTSDAAASVANPQMADALKQLQEKQLDNLKGIDGRWLVLADASPSMSAAGTLEMARQLAAVLARMVKDGVDLVFFHSTPRHFDVTGQTLDEIKAATRGIGQGGGTSIGCGLQLMADRKVTVDGIAVVSDGEENVTPRFVDAYRRYTQAMGIEPTVYFYWTSGTGEPFRSQCRGAGIDVQEFDLRSGVDKYSLPNAVQTMRVGRYQLLDDVLATPLKTLDGVLTRTTNLSVLPRGAAQPAEVTA